MDAEESDNSKTAVEGPIDHTILNQLRALGGADGAFMISELVSLFLQETAVQLATIATALDGQDFKKMQRAAHLLKCASGNVGAKRFSLLCHELEQAESTTELESARATARELRGEYVRVRDELARLIKRAA